MTPRPPMDFRVMPFRETRALWEEIGRDAIATPYADFDWLAAWCETVGAEAGIQPITLEVRAANRLLLLCPLMLQRRAGILTCSWLGGRAQNVNAPLFARAWFQRKPAGDFDQIWSGLKLALPKVDLFHLGRQAEHILGVQNPFYSQGYTARHRDPLYQVCMGEDFSVWTGERRSKNSRRRLHRRRRQLQRSIGPVEIVQPKSIADLERLLNTFFCQRSQSAHAGLVPNPFHDSELKRFVHRAAVAGLQGNRGLQLFALCAGGCVLATELVLVTSDNCSGFAKSMDLRFSKYSPGTLLAHDVLETIHARGIRYVDFGIGAERYKEAWTDRVELKDSYVPTTGRGVALMSAMMSVNAAWRVTKNLPGARPAIRWARRGLHASPLP